jgi:hypothetical protein
MRSNAECLRVRTMPANAGRALDWSKAQKVVFPDLKPSTETGRRSHQTGFSSHGWAQPSGARQLEELSEAVKLTRIKAKDTAQAPDCLRAI